MTNLPALDETLARRELETGILDAGDALPGEGRRPREPVGDGLVCTEKEPCRPAALRAARASASGGLTGRDENEGDEERMARRMRDNQIRVGVGNERCGPSLERGMPLARGA